MKGGLTVGSHHNIYGGDNESWDWTPQPHRKLSDMEIVEVEIRVK